MLWALIVWWPASFWLQWTMTKGTVHGGSPAKSPTKPTEEKKRKMYAIKQIKIRAEYRDKLSRPRLDLSGTPGLLHIGLSPGSWQTSLGLCNMSRYSAQIIICIFKLQDPQEISPVGATINEWKIVSLISEFEVLGLCLFKGVFTTHKFSRGLTHWPPEMWKECCQCFSHELMSWSLPMKLILGECYRTLFMASQHWFI